MEHERNARPTHCNQGVFVDWLDVTFPSDQGHLQAAYELLGNEYGFYLEPKGKGCLGHCLLPFLKMTGTAKLTSGGAQGWERLSLSGVALEYIRTLKGGWPRLLEWLAERPHFITRIDVALDLAAPAPAHLAHLASLPPSRLRLGSTSKLPKVKNITQFHEELGPQVETLMINDPRSATVSARVYDKQVQLRDKHKLQTGPCLRYELVVKGDRSKSKRTPCLRDVHDPTALFYHYMGLNFLEPPEGTPDWAPDDHFTFKVDAPKALEPHQRVERLMDNGLAQQLYAMVGDIDPELRVSYLLSCLARHLGCVANGIAKHSGRAPKSLAIWTATLKRFLERSGHKYYGRRRKAYHRAMKKVLKDIYETLTCTNAQSSHAPFASADFAC